MSEFFSIDFQSRYIFLYILISLAAIAISWWSYARVVQVSAFKKYILVGLRSVGIFLIGMLLLEPLLSVFSEKTTGSKLAVVVDVSSSMSVSENGQTREAIARSAVDNDLPSKIPLNYYGFADSLTELGNFPGSALFIGKATDLSRAFSTLISDNDDLGAVLIITDGASNIGIDPLKAASGFSKPVYSLVVGSGASGRDINISGVDYPPVEYTSTEFTIGVEIGARGYGGETGQVEIRRGKKVIGSQRITLPEDGAYKKAEFKISQAEAGVKNFQAVVAQLANETISENNIRNFTIKLLKDKIDILILSAALDWEFSFLKKALENDQQFEIAALVANQNNSFNINELPGSPDSWKEIELVIALDLDSRFIGPQLNNLRAAADAGTGFLYIAGAKTITGRLGRWEELLPVQTTAQSTVENGEFFPVPGGQPGARILFDIPGLKWTELPPLKFIMANLEVSDNAIVFFDVIDERGNHQPVITGGLLGRGKTAAITGYPWWQRYFRPVTGAADISRIEKFWGNLIRWLVVREDFEKFNVVPSKTVFKLGEPVTLSATLFDENYNLVSDARIEVVITDSSGVQRELQMIGIKPGQYSGNFGSPASGEYNFKAHAIVGSDTMATAQASFIVESLSLEMENPSANYSLLSQISAITGGMSYNVDNFSGFKNDLKLKKGASDIVKEYRLTGNTYLLTVIIVLFALEWGIRKFSQLA